jgi:hypothetical protein
MCTLHPEQPITACSNSAWSLGESSSAFQPPVATCDRQAKGDVPGKPQRSLPAFLRATEFKPSLCADSLVADTADAFIGAASFPHWWHEEVAALETEDIPFQ